jgi:hypothetical protein
MIELPTRSVTRFFVPLIDVLILLFCIFLLLPFVSRTDGEQSNSNGEGGALPTDVTALQQRLQLAEAQIKRLMEERQTLADKLNVRVLEIDAADGRLFAFNRDGGDEPQRQEIANQAAAQLLIDRARQTAGGKNVFFLILYPRKLTGFPLQRQIDDYRRWFKDAPHGFDNPWSAGS